MTRRTALPLTVAALTLFAACSDDSNKGSDNSATTAASGVSAIEAGKPIPQDRCDANKAADTLVEAAGLGPGDTAEHHRQRQ